jgi:hypothetical protein
VLGTVNTEHAALVARPVALVEIGRIEAHSEVAPPIHSAFTG